MTTTPTTTKTRADAIVGPANKWLSRQMIGELVQRMRQRRRDSFAAYRSAFANSGAPRAKMRKRKAALVLSAGVMGLSTAAADVAPLEQRTPAIKNLSPGIDYRTDASQLQVSETMKEALAEEEGVRLTVYRDVAGYPTVGVGHLVRPEDGLRVGDRISYDQALDFLEDDLKIAERGVARLVGHLKLYQHEFDALVDLVYNVGEGNVSPRKSPRLNGAIQAADYQGIADELHYHHAAGAKANGLVYRSERRQAIFMKAAYEDPRAPSTGAASSNAV